MARHLHASPYHGCSECRGLIPRTEVPFSRLSRENEIIVLKPVRIYGSPLALKGEFDLDIQPLPPIDWLKEPHPVLTRVRLKSVAAPRRMNAMGNILEDIFSFIKKIVKAIIDVIRAIIEKILEFFRNPLKLLRELLVYAVKFITGTIFLDFLGVDIFKLIFTAVDSVLGGFLSQVKTLFQAPASVAGDVLRSDTLSSVRSIASELPVKPAGVDVLSGGSADTILNGLASGDTGSVMSTLEDLGMNAATHAASDAIGPVGSAVLSGELPSSLNDLPASLDDASNALTHQLSDTSAITGGLPSIPGLDLPSLPNIDPKKLLEMGLSLLQPKKQESQPGAGESLQEVLGPMPEFKFDFGAKAKTGGGSNAAMLAVLAILGAGAVIVMRRKS